MRLAASTFGITIQLVACAASAAHAASIHIDLNCRAGGSGRSIECGSDGPLNDLERLGAACADRERPLVVEFAAGLQRFRSRFNMPAACAGRPDAPTVVQNRAGADSYLSGARRVRLKPGADEGSPFEAIPGAPGVFECRGPDCAPGAGSKFIWGAFVVRKDARRCQSDADCRAASPLAHCVDVSGERRCEDYLPAIQAKGSAHCANSGGSCDDDRDCGGSTCESSLYACSPSDPPEAGTMRYDPAPRSQRVCIRLVDDSDPDDAHLVEFPWQPYAFNFFHEHVSYVTVRSNPLGGHLTIEKFRDKILTARAQAAPRCVGGGASNECSANADCRDGGYCPPLNPSDASRGIRVGGPTTAEGVTLGMVQDRCIDFGPGGHADGPGDFYIGNNLVHFCGQENLRIQQDTSPRTLIENNVVSYTQHPAQFGGPCGHVSNGCSAGFADVGTCIRVALSRGATIRNNTFHHMFGAKTYRGQCINFENGSADHLVSGNMFYAFEQHGTTVNSASVGVHFSTIYPKNAFTNIVVENNRIVRPDACFSFDGVGQMTAGITVRNNTCFDPDQACLREEDGEWRHGEIRFDNNICSKPKGAMENRSLLLRIDRRNTAFLPPSGNVFHCPGCPRLVNWKVRSLAAAQIGSLGANTTAADPRLETSGNPPSLRIRDRTSSALGRAVHRDCAETDFENEPRTDSRGCDAGADQFKDRSETLGIRP